MCKLVFLDILKQTKFLSSLGSHALLDMQRVKWFDSEYGATESGRKETAPNERHRRHQTTTRIYRFQGPFAR